MKNKQTQPFAETNPIRQRLSGRISYLRGVGNVKDAELMRSALEKLTELVDATRLLLDDLDQPEDGAQANLMQRCRNAVADAA